MCCRRGDRERLAAARVPTARAREAMAEEKASAAAVKGMEREGERESRKWVKIMQQQRRLRGGRGCRVTKGRVVENLIGWIGTL